MTIWTKIGLSLSASESLAGWRVRFGESFPGIHPFLMPSTGERVDGYPCPQTGIRLAVRERSGGSFIAFATGDQAEDCEDVKLRWEDVQAWRLDLEKLKADWCRTLEIEHTTGADQGALLRLGLCKRCPHSGHVYVHLGGDGKNALQMIAALGKKSNVGCVMLAERSPSLEPVLESLGVATVVLPETVSWSGKNLGNCGDMCRRVSRDLTNREVVELTGRRFDKVDGGIVNVGKHVVELESENALLKQKLADLLAALAQRVEPEYLHWILVILASGSVNAAAKALKISGSTFAEKVNAYASRGGDYKVLHSMIAIRRKGMGRKKIEGYNEMFEEHQGEPSSPESNSWRDLLDGLEAMNAANWPKVREELIDLVKEQLPES